jgi:hypothetical protein
MRRLYGALCRLEHSISHLIHIRLFAQTLAERRERLDRIILLPIKTPIDGPLDTAAQWSKRRRDCPGGHDHRQIGVCTGDQAQQRIIAYNARTVDQR